MSTLSSTATKHGFIIEARAPQAERNLITALSDDQLQVLIHYHACVDSIKQVGKLVVTEIREDEADNLNSLEDALRDALKYAEALPTTMIQSTKFFKGLYMISHASLKPGAPIAGVKKVFIDAKLKLTEVLDDLADEKLDWPS